MSLERLGVLPKGRLREALRPGVRAGEALVGSLAVLALVLVIHYEALLAILRGQGTVAEAQRLCGSLLVLGGLVAIGLVYLSRFQRRIVITGRDLLVFASCCVGSVAVAKAFLAIDAHVGAEWRSLVFLTPVSAFAIFFAVVYGQRPAIAACIMMALLVGLAVAVEPPAIQRPPSAQALPVAVVLLCGSLTATLASRRIRKRTKLLNVGLLVGLVHATLVLGFELVSGDLASNGAHLRQALLAFANGLGVGVLLTIGLPVIELVFNVATEIRLLELSDQEQPLLRSLVTHAPSTDNHSRRVALLAEAAAEAIGANSLLALVGSYYHDIGKMAKPNYFIENQVGNSSPHDRLRPSMSALIIGGHVKDGIELARDAKLPRAIIDLIAQHHGTSVIEFFYNRYLEEAGDKPDLDASFFRYPGPKPATKEAAIVLIADSVEAASRTLSEPVPSRIETLIHRITSAKLAGGQLDDSHLTLSELRRIEQSFFRVLCSMYHARIEYPSAATAP